jgi:hypothetical protein
MRKLLLLARILDLLERDYRQCYPDEAPVLPDGFEQALRDLIFPK